MAKTSHETFSTTAAGSTAFGDGSDKYQSVIHDLFMSFARPYEQDAPPCLQTEDLEALLLAIGEKPRPETLQKLIQEVDMDGNGTIELEEFLEGCDKILGAADDEEANKVIDIGELVDTFRTLDRDGNGVLTLDELEGLLSTAGGHLQATDAQEIFQLADTDGNGVIDLSEFIEFVTDPAASRYAWRLTSGFRVILIIGGPGSGKGELCQRLKDRAHV